MNLRKAMTSEDQKDIESDKKVSFYLLNINSNHKSNLVFIILLTET